MLSGNSNQSGTGWGSGNVGGGEGGGEVQPFFEESFSGGVFNEANGFDWAPSGFGQRQTSISADPENPALFALQFSYHEADDSNPSHRVPFNYDNSEMYFDMGRELSEVWIQYQWRPPSGLLMGGQNKGFVLFRNLYTGTNEFRCLFEHWAQLTPTYDQTKSKIRMMRPPAASDGGAGIVTHWIPETDRSPLVSPTGPVIPGQWNDMKVHLKLSSGFDVPDGVFEVFANGSVVESYTGQKLWNFVDGEFPDCKVRRGYFMGASDGGFGDAPTTWHIKDPKFFDTNPGWV